MDNFYNQQAQGIGHRVGDGGIQNESVRNLRKPT